MFWRIISVTLAIGLAVGCGKKEETPGPASAAPVKKSKSAYKALDAVKDGGSIQGSVLYAGTDTDGQLTINKDNAICDPTGTGKIAEGALLVADGKLKNAVVYLEGIKEGKAFANQDVTVDNKGCQFSPRVTVAHKGDMLAAKNSDPVLHNMHTVLKKKNKRKELDNLPLNKGVVIKKKLKRTGQVDVKCDAHEWMQGTVWVFSHPYSALTDANGSFSLTDVPPGDYNLKVWHEKLGVQTNKVSVKAGAAATQDVTFK
jgi:plastocyanin